MSEESKYDWDKLMGVANRSPYYQLLGMKIVEMKEGWARLTMPASDKLFQAGGVVHGGAIASLADSATAYALFTLVERGNDTTTIELKINYLRPASGGELTAEARVVNKGQRIAVMDVEVRRDDGKMVAKGMATMMIIAGGRQREG